MSGIVARWAVVVVVLVSAPASAAAGGENPARRCQAEHDALMARYQARNDADLEKTIEELRRRPSRASETMEQIVAKAEGLMAEKLRMHRKIARMEFRSCMRRLTAGDAAEGK